MNCAHSLFFGQCYTTPLLNGVAGLVLIGILIAVGWLILHDSEASR